jgi:hypothetical protein
LFSDEIPLVIADNARLGRRWWARRVVIVVALQAVGAIGAYSGSHQVLGWHMFSASSDWRADVLRVTSDGARHPISDPWPGGYRWPDLVSARGLGSPQVRQHATAGLAVTLDHLSHAIDWVALHTPADGVTVRLEADVTYWHNGRGPVTTLSVSAERPVGPP